MSIPYCSPSKGGLSLLILQSWVPDWFPCLTVEPFLDSSNNLFRMLSYSVAYQWLHSKGRVEDCFSSLYVLYFSIRCSGLLCVCVCVCVCMSTQSCPTLCDPMDFSPPGSSVHGVLQARILEWVAISFSRGSSQPRDQTRVSRVAGRFFTI